MRGVLGDIHFSSLVADRKVASAPISFSALSVKTGMRGVLGDIHRSSHYIIAVDREVTSAPISTQQIVTKSKKIQMAVEGCPRVAYYVVY